MIAASPISAESGKLIIELLPPMSHVFPICSHSAICRAKHRAAHEGGSASITERALHLVLRMDPPGRVRPPNGQWALSRSICAAIARRAGGKQPNANPLQARVICSLSADRSIGSRFSAAWRHHPPPTAGARLHRHAATRSPHPTGCDRACHARRAQIRAPATVGSSRDRHSGRQHGAG